MFCFCKMLYRKTGFLNNAPQSTSTMLTGAKGKWQRLLMYSEWNICHHADESEVDEETRRVKRYVVRRFSWESRELKPAKKKLDRSHQHSLPGLSKRVFIPREQLPRLGMWSRESPSNMDRNQQLEMPDDDGLDDSVDLNISR